MSRKSRSPGTGDAEAPKVSSEEEQRNLLDQSAPVSPAKSSRYGEVRAVLELLQERWPNCFSIYEPRRKPLKIGIHEEILKALAGVVAKDELRNALRCYVSNARYLKAITVGASRIDLNGEPAAVIDEEAAAYSAGKLKWAKFEKHRKKMNAELDRYRRKP